MRENVAGGGNLESPPAGELVWCGGPPAAGARARRGRVLGTARWSSNNSSSSSNSSQQLPQHQHRPNCAHTRSYFSSVTLLLIHILSLKCGLFHSDTESSGPGSKSELSPRLRLVTITVHFHLYICGSFRGNASLYLRSMILLGMVEGRTAAGVYLGSIASSNTRPALAGCSTRAASAQL